MGRATAVGPRDAELIPVCSGPRKMNLRIARVRGRFPTEEMSRDMAGVSPAVRSDYRAPGTYQIQDEPKPFCPVVALTGDLGPQFTLDEAGTRGERTEDSFEMRASPIDHVCINSQAEQVPQATRGHVSLNVNRLSTRKATV